MGAFVKAWSPCLAAVLVVLSVISTGRTMRTHTESIQGRLADVETQIASIRNTLEGNQGVMVRLATLDFHMGDKLQNLIVQRDNYIEQNGQEWLDIHDMREELQTVKNHVETIVTVTQRIEYLEEMLLEMRGTLEELKKQQPKERQSP